MTALTVIAIPINAVALLLSAFLDHDRRFVLVVNQVWCRLVGSSQPLWRHEVRGEENIDPEQAYVIASNHASAADIILLAFLDKPFRWVAKRSLYFVPLFGWQLWALGHLVIQRGSRASRTRFMQRALRTLADGLSILIFPEGTRSRTGRMRDFKPGAFILSRDSGCPVLPVVVAGTFEAMPPKQHLLRNRIHAIFKVLEPVQVPPDAGPGDIERIMEELRDRMIAEKRELDRESDVMVERWTLSSIRR
jgi:1-acyl-sn-glycerol-3-phosphate acyltransferase